MTESSIDLPSVILTCLVIAALLETVAPARPSPHLLKRWVNNLSLSALTYAFNHFALTALAIYLLEPYENQPVIDFSGLTIWLSVPMCVLVYDLVAYALHVASHKVPLFWRFHSVHHADEQVDISTAFRHHPLESLISLLPLLILSVCLGLPVEALLVYRMLELAQKVFTHTNVKVPDALEVTVGKLLVTPRFHRSHHFSDSGYTDSNYGSVLPWFDYFFKTYRKTDEAEDLGKPLGLGLHGDDSCRIDRLLLLPFKKVLPNHS